MPCSSRSHHQHSSTLLPSSILCLSSLIPQAGFLQFRKPHFTLTSRPQSSHCKQLSAKSEHNQPPRSRHQHVLHYRRNLSFPRDRLRFSYGGACSCPCPLGSQPNWYPARCRQCLLHSVRWLRCECLLRPIMGSRARKGLRGH